MDSAPYHLRPWAWGGQSSRDPRARPPSGTVPCRWSWCLWEALEEEGGRQRSTKTTTRTGVKTVGNLKDRNIVATFVFQQAITRANGQQYVQWPGNPRTRAMHIERACVAGWQGKGQRRKNTTGRGASTAVAERKARESKESRPHRRRADVPRAFRHAHTIQLARTLRPYLRTSLRRRCLPRLGNCSQTGTM